MNEIYQIICKFQLLSIKYWERVFKLINANINTIEKINSEYKVMLWFNFHYKL